MRARFEPGDSVLWRGGVERVRWALPHTFVQEGDERLAIYCQPGVRGKRPKHAYVDYPDQLATGDWEIRDFEWKLNHVLRLTPFGRAHSLDLYWAGNTWQFRGWYVNLQEPIRRTPYGFDFRDLALDLLVAPDLSWCPKDEDHLAQGAELGIFSAAEVRAVHDERDRVLARLDELFPTGWEGFRPDPSWSTPELPAEWARVE